MSDYPNVETISRIWREGRFWNAQVFRDGRSEKMQLGFKTQKAAMQWCEGAKP